MAKTDAEWHDFCRPFVFLNGSHEFPNYGAICRAVWQASRKQMAEEAAASISKLASSWEESAKRGRGADPLMLELLQICARDARATIRSLATPTEGKTA